MPGKPDIVFVSAKVAVFCDGDFWHGRHWERRMAEGQLKVRRRYWINKIEDNIRRDKRVNRKLKEAGWIVMRFWETDIKSDGPEIGRVVARVVRKRLRLSRNRR